MAEESKARLVRCPKCESLIKELPQYSFYKCGSCGAVLRAKKKEHAFLEDKGKYSRKDRFYGDKSMDVNVHEKNEREHRLNHDRTERIDGYVDDYVPQQPKNPMNYWAHQKHDHHDMNTNMSKSVNSSRESKFGDYSPRLDNLTRSLRMKGVDRDGFGGFYKSLEPINEGPSTYRSASAYGYHKPMKRSGGLDLPNGVQNSDKDRTQLLKKLDELKHQLSRSHDMPQRPREMVLSDNNMASTDHLGSSIGTSLAHLRPAGTRDEQVGSFHGNFHSVSKHAHCETPRGDSLSPALHRRPHNQVLHQHPQQRTYGYTSGKYPNQAEALHHLPACSCSYCYEKNWKDPLQVPPAYVSSNRFGQHYLPRPTKYPQSNFEDPPLHLGPSVIDSGIDGFGRRCPRRVVVTGRDKRLCRPIASAAPFITCNNCLELLKLPRKFRKLMKNEQSVQCGACSSVIVFEMEKKRLIISATGNAKQTPTEAKETSTELGTESHPSSHGYFNAGGTIQKSSEEEQSPDNVIDWRDSPGSSEIPFSHEISSTVSTLPFQEQAKVPSSNQTVSGYRGGTRPKHEGKVILVKNASQVVSRRNSPRVAMETEVSSNACRSSSSCRDSLEASKEQNQLLLHKGSKSYLVGLIKKSFREFSRSYDSIKNGMPNVSVNGQLIPESVVRKAERQAGPILPGNYWYDSRAGFWGVMGQPCSGIIPSFIEEFNYPMLKNCAAGNTGVIINGRELHQKDLDLLACKGLPTARDKSYIIEVSGRVLDEDTGIQLCSLGKLAPTVEKQKRGFGMRVAGVVE